MLVPLSWLQDYIDLHESVEDLRDLLTYSGLEVEGVETHGSDFGRFVVAEITAVDPHPDADRLTLCTVEIGADSPMRVVCGAPNVRAGLHTVYAPVGAILPDGTKLKKAKIRGVESLGMLCAEDELGLSGDHSGIMELSDELAAGTPAVDVLGGPEVVFDLEVTPNRPDCLSIIGVARELAALTGRALRLPGLNLSAPESSEQMTVDIESAEACPRYTARVLSGAQIAPSPDWMQKRLRLCGLRPINNVVDITNYVLLETGHPLHAFDHAKLEGNTIRIRSADPNETLHTLNGEEQELSTEDLVIADATKAVALAGVMGGANSEITGDTRDLLIESAAFQSSRIRGTAKRLNCHTDSSHRFARGCDVTALDWVSDRACSLLIEHAGILSLGPLVDVYPGKQEPRRIKCQWKTINNLIGIGIPADQMSGYFERLGLTIQERNENGCTVQIPGFRQDLTRPVDLTEEIARLNGLDKIPAPAPRARIVSNARDPETRALVMIWRHLTARGFLETLNYSLCTPEILSQLDSENRQQQVILPNPISRDQSVLRSSLLPQMVQSLAYNKAHQIDELALFEEGKTYLQAAEGVLEQNRVCLGSMGPWCRPELDKQRPLTDREAYADLKGEVENMFYLLGCEQSCQWMPTDDPAFGKGQAAEIRFGDTVIGRIGLLSAKIKQTHKLTGPVALAEIDLTHILPEPGLPSGMTPIPEYPSTTRDAALILDRSRTHQEVIDLVNRERPRDLVQVRLFDLFESDKLGENKKSMAYRFTYRNSKKTLTDEAVEKMHGRIVDRLLSELNAEIVGK
ncbi:MAG: phenylalanine--tRNA ligase subunit beta [Kiritimatiellia bacterium]